MATPPAAVGGKGGGGAAPAAGGDGGDSGTGDHGGDGQEISGSSKRKTFYVEPETLELAIGETAEVRVWAFPTEARVYKDTLIACLTDNPRPVLFPVSCSGAAPLMMLEGPWDKILSTEQAALGELGGPEVSMHAVSLFVRSLLSCSACRYEYSNMHLNSSQTRQCSFRGFRCGRRRRRRRSDLCLFYPDYISGHCYRTHRWFPYGYATNELDRDLLFILLSCVCVDGRLSVDDTEMCVKHTSFVPPQRTTTNDQTTKGHGAEGNVAVSPVVGGR